MNFERRASDGVEKMEGDVERANEGNGGRGGDRAATRARTGVPSEGELGRQTLTGRG